MNSISFDFYEPSIPSPYAVPPGVSLEETARALLVGEWPMTTSTASHSTGSPSESAAPSPSSTFAQDGSPVRPLSPLSSLDDLSAIHPNNLTEDIANLGMESSEVVSHSDDQTQRPTCI
jgi:hypothetical protein